MAVVTPGYVGLVESETKVLLAARISLLSLAFRLVENDTTLTAQSSVRVAFHSSTVFHSSLDRTQHAVWRDRFNQIAERKTLLR